MLCFDEYGNFSVKRFWASIVVCMSVFFLLMLFFNGFHRVPAGYVGIKVHLLGGSKGIDIEPIGVGRYMRSINLEYHNFPTFTQNHNWDGDEAITFQTSEGMTVTTNIGISFYVKPNKAVQVFQKYRQDVNEIVDLYLRNMTRDAFVKESSKRSIAQITSTEKITMLEAVEEDVREQVSDVGIEVERIYYIGQFVLPGVVQQSIDATIQATQLAQQRQNEIAQSKAMADKQIEEARGEAESRLIRARSEAESNKIVALSVTDELVRYQTIQKWDGALPRFGNSSVVPFINVNDK